ncbi:hypothetical protein RyT2_00640 [Pseudolactococcus yaeyamensis]
MKDFKILGWRLYLLAVFVGLLLFSLLKLYPMLTYYFPASQRGIYKGTDETTGKTIVLDSRKANVIKQIRVSDDERDIWFSYDYASHNRTISKGKDDKMRWLGFKLDEADRHLNYIWIYPARQNKLASLVVCDWQTGKTVATYHLVREK